VALRSADEPSGGTGGHFRSSSDLLSRASRPTRGPVPSPKQHLLTNVAG
jgi:hypothetical protein